MMKKLLNITFNNFYLCLFYIFTSFSFVTVFKTIPGINILAKIALLWGVIISFNSLYTIFKRKPYSIEWFIFLFLFITFILNLLDYANIDNIKIWIVDLILLTSVFFVNKVKSKVILEKELFIISNFYISLTFILSSISLILFILMKTIIINDFTIGGTNGIFENQNALGISAAISFLITLYLIFSVTSKKYKVAYLINLLIQAPIVILSEARSSYFVFISLIGIFVFIKLRSTILRIIFLTIPCLCFAYTFTLKNNVLYNFTQGRNELWTSAILVIKNNFISGVGNFDLVNKVLEIRSSVYLPQGLKHAGVHNIYIQVFTANGVFALISLILFLAISLFCILNRIIILKFKDDIRFYLLFSLIVSILLMNIFESNLVYIISFISIIFWTYLGYTLSLIEAEKRDEI